jgi:hypothetical protein
VVEFGGLYDLPHGRRSDRTAESDELALDASVAPGVPKSPSEPLTRDDRRHIRAMHDHGRVASTALPDLRSRTTQQTRNLLMDLDGLPPPSDFLSGHYNGRRPHRALHLRPPRPDHPALDLNRRRISRRPVLGGLISEYERAA